MFVNQNLRQLNQYNQYINIDDNHPDKELVKLVRIINEIDNRYQNEYEFMIYSGINIFEKAGPSDQYYYVLKYLLFFIRKHGFPRNINLDMLRIIHGNNNNSKKLIEIFVNENIKHQQNENRMMQNRRNYN